MDEYLFSSLLALLKLNQWGKKKEKKSFPIFCFPFIFLSQAVLHIIPWLLNHDELQVHLWQEKQPSPLPFHPHYSHAGFLLNFWTESTALYVPQCTVTLPESVPRDGPAESHHINPPQMEKLKQSPKLSGIPTDVIFPDSES